MPFIHDPIAVLAVLLGVLASLFFVAGRPLGIRFFRVIPLLLFAYFIPTLLSNVGVIPLKSPTYTFIKTYLLPASLLLMTMSVDIPAILKLGRNILLLFLTGTMTIVIGGPVAYLLLGPRIPAEMADQAWRGLAALSGSWIGGGANFVAIGESVGVNDSMLGTMVVIDVILANLWMAVLLFLAGHEKRIDDALGADRTSLEKLQAEIEKFQKKVARETSLVDLFAIFFLAVGGTVLALHGGVSLATVFDTHFPSFGSILGPFAWTVILVTALGVLGSFTPLRNLEGAGASRIGSFFLYLLVASIGAKADFEEVFHSVSILKVAALWIAFHAVGMLVVQRLLKAPTFFMAVGSQANIGGAASAPIVASAFHPSLAPVGALMGVAGYIMGTYAGLACAFLLNLVHQWQ